jgi:Leucine-rich repeat (LRR) protein
LSAEPTGAQAQRQRTLLYVGYSMFARINAVLKPLQSCLTLSCTVAMTIRGAVPPELGSLPRLQVLCLHNNRLQGALPYELSSLTSLRELYVSGNALSTTADDLRFLLPHCEKIYC